MSRNFTSLIYSKQLFNRGIDAQTFNAVWMGEVLALGYRECDGIVVVPAWGASELKFACSAAYSLNPQLREPKYNPNTRQYQHEAIWEVYLPESMQAFETEADAAAVWVLYLLERKALTLQEVNYRLGRLK